MGQDALERMSDLDTEGADRMRERIDSSHQSAVSFLIPDGEISRSRAGLLFIESYRELPLLTWPRKLIDAFVELEESMAKWMHDHAEWTTWMQQPDTEFSRTCGKLGRYSLNLRIDLT